MRRVQAPLPVPELHSGSHRAALEGRHGPLGEPPASLQLLQFNQGDDGPGGVRRKARSARDDIGGMNTRKTPAKPREMEIIHPSYQPSAAELREDLRLEGTFQGAIKALVQPAKVRYVLPKKRKCSG